MPFTHRNLKQDLEDVGSNFDGAPDLEFRLATDALELEQSGLSYQRIPPGYRFPYGHTHKTQEEVYVVVRGSGRMKLDDEIVELEEWDAVRVPPGTWRGYEAGPEASRSSSSARPASARAGARTSRASATGGPTSAGVDLGHKVRSAATDEVTANHEATDRDLLLKGMRRRLPCSMTVMRSGCSGSCGGAVPMARRRRIWLRRCSRRRSAAAAGIAPRARLRMRGCWRSRPTSSTRRCDPAMPNAARGRDSRCAPSRSPTTMLRASTRWPRCRSSSNCCRTCPRISAPRSWPGSSTRASTPTSRIRRASARPLFVSA